MHNYNMHGTGNVYKSDLFNLYNFVQGSMLTYPKQLIIDTLKEIFAKDSYYHYAKDEWGFAKVVDHTDLDLEAGFHNESTTRVYIGEKNKYQAIYYPAILVSSGGMRSVPISMNREKGSIQYSQITVVDGYGNSKQFRTPESYILAGVYEGSINIDIKGRGLKERDELVEIVTNILNDIQADQLARAGVHIKSGSPSFGAPGESEDRNDKLYTQTISLEIRTEWRRNIPILNYVDIINICVEFGRSPSTIAPNLTINEKITLDDII